MKLKIISDLHLEFHNHGNNKAKFTRTMEHYFPTQEHDKDCTLVCAGDIGKFYNSYDTTLKMFFAYVSKRFNHVVIVPGNHEYYSSNGIWDREAEFWKTKQLPKNVYYLDNDYKIIDNVMFIGSCLWTSCDSRNSITMYHVEKGMNDYNWIKKGTGTYGDIRLTTEDTVERHEQSVYFIKQALQYARDNKYTPVVVTHHAPSYKSVHPKYRGDMLNHAFYSDLEWLMYSYSYPLHIHGHMHNSFNYVVDETRVICNPFGYVGTLDQNTEFNKDLVVEV